MADSEVRQKFEVWSKTKEGWDIWRAAYEAGEIAMKEKAAELAKSCAEILSPEQTVGARWIGDKIRALPLSGAEEAKK